jgi:hypothetical protein
MGVVDSWQFANKHGYIHSSFALSGGLNKGKTTQLILNQG